MTVPINTTEAGFFKVYLQLLNPILKLKDKELEVLSVFLTVWHKNRNNPRVMQYLFTTSTLRSIRNYLAMDAASFNNYKYSLRKKGIFTKNSITPLILKNIESDLSKQTITYDFNINTPIDQIKKTKTEAANTKQKENLETSNV